jgi:hypothetical protein
MNPRSNAFISQCKKYRYTLTRGGPMKVLPFIMLNPSTADESLDDPTIRRCRNFAITFGYNGIVVVNLYAFRATKPSDLWLADDPIGPLNDFFLTTIARSPEVVCAWGANARQDRVDEVVKLLKFNGTQLRCLGVTKDNAPRHPLYIKNSQPLIDWIPS